MELNIRVNSFVQLGKIFDYIGNSKSWDGYHIGISEDEFKQLEKAIPLSRIHNGWFEEVFVRLAFKNLALMLDEKALKTWVESYQLNDNEPLKTVALIMAGNIPLVGFHDLLCVLITGNKAKIKLSTDDTILMLAVLEILYLLQPEFKNRIDLVKGKLEGFDAVIATGSNNTSRYFEHYFGKYPNIIRKNRTSVAVLSGNETDEELKLLADDIFSFYGLGCRNVSKVYLPEGFDLDRLFKAFFHYQWVMDNKKYANNYDYHRALFMMNQEPFLENGFFILRNNSQLHAPLSTLNYEFYQHIDAVNKYLSESNEVLQCVVGQEFFAYGCSQTPLPNNYADGEDTINFLLKSFCK
jgi:hypothetical protein